MIFRQTMELMTPEGICTPGLASGDPFTDMGVS